MSSGSYRYTVTFEAGEIVDDRLSRLLDTVFGGRDVEIAREALRRSPRNVKLYPDELAVLEILADRQAHRRKTLLAQLGWQNPPARFYRVMQGLIDIDAVRKVRQGVYAMADAPQDLAIPDAHNAVERKRQSQVLAWLHMPLSAPELRERLGVTRQRVDQILKSLEREGLIIRRPTPGEAATFVWVKVDRRVAAVLRRRPPRLAAGKRSILSSLRPERLVLANELADHLSRGYQITLRALKDLERKGRLTTFRLGAKTYVTITALGVQHPQYGDLASSAEEADILAGFGAARVALLQALQILGPQRTLDLTYAVDPAVFEGARSSGQYIQALEREELIAAEAGSSGHAKYGLTAKGAVAVQLIALACVPPSLETLEAAWRERWTARREAQKRSVRRAQGPRQLTVHQASVIDVLRREGSLTRSEIFDRMDAPPKNGASLALMLKSLLGRQMVERLPSHGGRGLAHRWQVVAEPGEDNT